MAQSRPPRPNAPNRRVILVSTDSALRHLAQEVASQLGLRLSLLDRPTFSPETLEWDAVDIVILHLTPADSDPDVTCRYAHAACPDAVLLALAPHGEPGATERLLSAGATDVLSTPITAADLALRLTVLRSRRHVWTPPELAALDFTRQTGVIPRVLSVIGSLVVVIDPSGRVVHFNPAAEQATGYSAEEVVGRRFWEVYQPPNERDHSRAAVEQYGDRIHTVLPPFQESAILTRGGERRTIHWTNTAIVDQEGRTRFVIGSGLDVTDEKAAQDALRQAEARTRNILDNLPDLLLTLDRSGICVDVKPVPGGSATVRQALLGQPIEGLRRVTAAERIDGTLLVARECFERALHGGETVSFDFIVELPGATRFFESRFFPGAPGEVLVLVRDISERRRDQEELDRSRRGFRAVIESITDGIAILRGDRIRYTNPSFKRTLGLSTDTDLTDQRLLDLVHPEDRPSLGGRIAAAAATDRPQPASELRLMRLDGGDLMAEVPLVAPVEFEGSAAVLVVARDVTEARRLEARLRLADRLTSVGTLAAGVAHQVNNPLATVVANLSLLTEELPKLASALPERDRSELGEMLDDARVGASRVQQIVRDLGIFARAEGTKLGPLDVVRTLQATLNIAANQIRHRARLVADLQPVGPVLGNPARLGQVFLNLLINAVQALPTGAADQHEIRARCHTDGDDWVQIEISDTGPGMTEEVKRRLFDPFFTTKPASEGLGLGLTMSHSIVQGMGGEIEVVSELGQGATFRVCLPTMREAKPTPASQVARSPSALVRRVLVVDDEPMIVKSLTRLLRGHEVLVATSGREALRHCAAHEFDLILCDLIMPELTGMDVHESLSRTHPGQEARMVFMTGGAFTRRSAEFLETVPNLSIEKPFDLDEVRALLDRELLR